MSLNKKIGWRRVLLFCVFLVYSIGQSTANEDRLRLATTASTHDSGASSVYGEI